MRRLLIILILFLLSSSAWGAEYVIGTGTSTVDGDTFCSGTCTGADNIIIAGGTRGKLTIKDMNGSSGDWIDIKNPTDAKVTITGATSPDSAIRIETSRYIQLLGNNYGSETYGIQLTSNYRGMRLYDVRDYEIGFIEIDDSTGATGLIHNTNSWGEEIEIENVSYHDLYIHDVYYSAMYLGNSSVGDYSKFKDIQVYNILLADIGCEGIQLSQATGTGNKIYDCTIYRTGRNGGPTGACVGAAIMINPEVTGLDVYRNYIEDTGLYADGMYFNPMDGLADVHDNVIWKAADDGIRATITTGNKFINNTIVSSGGWGIKTTGEGELRYNLLIANGAGGKSSDFTTQNDNRCPSGCDFTSAGVVGEYFTDAESGDFSLTSDSPALNAGAGAGYSTTDYNGDTRPCNSTAANIGAYEDACTASVLSGLLPSGTLACTSDPRNVTLEVTSTDTTNCTVKYHTSDVVYDSMGSTFTNTDAKSHSETISLACGDTYTYYIRSEDDYGVQNSSSETITFTIDAAEPPAITKSYTVTGGGVSGGGIN